MRNKLVLILALVSVAFAVFGGDITSRGMNQGDLYTFLSRVVTLGNEVKGDHNVRRGITRTKCNTYVGLASNTAAVKTTYDAHFQIADVMYFLASETSVDLIAGTLSSGTAANYLISVNAAGTATCTKGTAVAYSATPSLPAIPSAHCPLAYLKVVNVNATFTAGTDALGGTGRTCTFVNLATVDSGSSADSEVSASDLSLTGL